MRGAPGGYVRPMWFLLFVGCYERVIADITVSPARGTVTAVVQQQGWDDRFSGDGCGDAAACLAALQRERAERRDELVRGGATDVITGFVVREGELDLVERYTAPIDAKLFQDDAVVRAIGWQRGKRSDRVASLFVAAEEKETRTVVEATRGERWDLGELGTLWTFRRGRAQVHVVTEILDEGTPVQITPWLGERAGLLAALEASPLKLDPSTLVTP